MLAVRETKDGFLWAVMVYGIVDEKGISKDDGEYCFVSETWIHPKYRNIKILKDIVREEHLKYPKVHTIYFLQRRRNKRQRVHNIRSFYEEK